MKKSVLSFVLLVTFILGSAPLRAEEYYCSYKGVKYTLGQVIEKFGDSASMVKSCCECGTPRQLCYPGISEKNKSDGLYYNLTLIAAKYNRFNSLRYLVEVCKQAGGRTPTLNNWPYRTYLQPQEEYTELMWAVKNGNLQMVNYLLKRGADANLKNRYGKNAKDIASELGNQEIISALRNNAYSGLLDTKYKQEIINMLTFDEAGKEKALADLGLSLDFGKLI